MREVGHTIAVVNKSGRVVSTSKHLMSVFKEAKNAYRERKAEIVAERQGRLEERQTRNGIEAMTLSDESRSEYTERTRRRNHRSGHHRDPESRDRPPTARHYSASTVRSATSSRRSASVSPRIPSRSTSRTLDISPNTSPGRPSMTMARRHTELDLAMSSPTRHSPKRANSTSAIDMDLAYGDCHPHSLKTYSQNQTDAEEIKGLVSKVKALLDEADCARASVTATIAHLQKNPEAMAAVALTLAEISNIAAKMAPGALSALKGSAPAVFALLAAPEFLIAAGVGVGITVVMFGGYKIIKKLKAKAELEKESDGMDEMVALSDVNLDRIEHWRRGIADVEMESSGSTVEGEFITPLAAKMRSSTSVGRMSMTVPGRSSSKSKAGDVKSAKSSKSKKGSKHKKEKDESSTHGSSSGADKDKRLIKAKKPSPLRKIFT